MVTSKSLTKKFLISCLPYLYFSTFVGLLTSRTIKPTSLSNNDIEQAVSMGKFEPCNER